MQLMKISNVFTNIKFNKRTLLKWLEVGYLFYLLGASGLWFNTPKRRHEVRLMIDLYNTDPEIGGIGAQSKIEGLLGIIGVLIAFFAANVYLVKLLWTTLGKTDYDLNYNKLRKWVGLSKAVVVLLVLGFLYSLYQNGGWILFNISLALFILCKTLTITAVNYIAREMWVQNIIDVGTKINHIMNVENCGVGLESDEKTKSLSLIDLARIYAIPLEKEDQSSSDSMVPAEKEDKSSTESTV